jgi:hypothetical protein
MNLWKIATLIYFITMANFSVASNSYTKEDSIKILIPRNVGDISTKYLETMGTIEHYCISGVSGLIASMTGYFLYCSYQACTGDCSILYAGLTSAGALSTYVVSFIKNRRYKQVLLENALRYLNVQDEESRAYLEYYVDKIRKKKPAMTGITVKSLAENIVAANAAGYFVPPSSFIAQEITDKYAGSTDTPSPHISDYKYEKYNFLTPNAITEELMKCELKDIQADAQKANKALREYDEKAQKYVEAVKRAQQKYALEER